MVEAEENGHLGRGRFRKALRRFISSGYCQRADSHLLCIRQGRVVFMDWVFHASTNVQGVTLYRGYGTILPEIQDSWSVSFLEETTLTMAPVL